MRRDKLSSLERILYPILGYYSPQKPKILRLLNQTLTIKTIWNYNLYTKARDQILKFVPVA